MGKLLGGIYGPTTGTTGNLTSYVLNGQNIIRMRAHSRTRSSERQLDNEMRMKVISDFFFHMKPILKAGFGPAAKNTTKNYYNIAVSYNKKHALKGFYPNVEVDYPNVLLSDGDLLPAENPVAKRVSGGIEFTWDTDGFAWGNGADQVMVLAYFPESGRREMFCYGARRMEGREFLPLQDNQMEQPAETYISFISPDRSEVARSIYLGQV
ncbi:hypothetical protein ABIE26_001716 [Pedobacter africanus]|uniref:Uncharacterized protein n=1 Tax=Pedobacter africanus TaxID=151894 RepID=A0ACC6KRG5_9SPHI|nr:DUF6266 family protein [Pedobacter africanus]MDR6781796.1 hypothetical protein [Pedobacter africanus]